MDMRTGNNQNEEEFGIHPKNFLFSHLGFSAGSTVHKPHDAIHYRDGFGQYFRK
jgi:hypothetical protein